MRIWEFHFHFHKEKGLKAALKEIKCLIFSNQTKIETIMATQEQFAAALSRIDAATTKAATGVTAIGVRITALEDAIKNAGLPAEVEATLLAQVEGVAGSTEALATTLEAMGKTPENPVPEPVPEPVPPVE